MGAFMSQVTSSYLIQVIPPLQRSYSSPSLIFADIILG